MTSQEIAGARNSGVCSGRLARRRGTTGNVTQEGHRRVGIEEHSTDPVVVRVCDVERAVRCDLRAEGRFNWASVARPPSPENPATPDPATVEMIPVRASIRRTRWFSVSATYTLFVASTATPRGALSPASTAGPASPENVPRPAESLVPFPATVVMTPVCAATRWMRSLNFLGKFGGAARI